MPQMINLGSEIIRINPAKNTIDIPPLKVATGTCATAVPPAAISSTSWTEATSSWPTPAKGSTTPPATAAPGTAADEIDPASHNASFGAADMKFRNDK